jgi:hypothetical protein
LRQHRDNDESKEQKKMELKISSHHRAKSTRSENTNSMPLLDLMTLRFSYPLVCRLQNTKLAFPERHPVRFKARSEEMRTTGSFSAEARRQDHQIIEYLSRSSRSLFPDLPPKGLTN